MAENIPFTFTWKIEHFSFKTCDVNESLVSPRFYAVPLLGTGWTLDLFPKGKASMGCDSTDHISCFLLRCGLCGPEKITIQFEFAIIGKDDSILLPWKSQLQVFESGKSGWGKLQLWNKFQLLKKKDLYFPEDHFTIQCCMTMQNDPALNSSMAKTVIECEKLSFRRSIENVSEFLNPGHHVDIKLPFMDPFDMVVCSSTDETEYLSSCIRKVRKNDKRSFIMRGKISLLDAEGNPKISREGEYLFRGGNSEWNFSLINFEKLRKEKTLVDDTLILLFELSLSDGQSTTETKTSDEALLLKENDERILHLSKWVEDIQRCLQSGDYSDFTVRCDGKVFPVHRMILSARSPVFHRMFQTDVLEKKNGEVTIKELTSSTLKHLFDFMYSARALCENLDDVVSLLYAAQRYQVFILKDLCSATLKENITLDNVCAILMVADQCGLENLKREALKIIRQHPEVLDSENFTRLSRANVKLEVEVRRMVHSFQKNQQKK